MNARYLNWTYTTPTIIKMGVCFFGGRDTAIFLDDFLGLTQAPVFKMSVEEHLFLGDVINGGAPFVYKCGFSAALARTNNYTTMMRATKRRCYCFCAGECLCRLSAAEAGMHYAFVNEQQALFMAESEYNDLAFLDYYRRNNRGVKLEGEPTAKPAAKRSVVTAVGRGAKQAEKMRADAEHAEFVRRNTGKSWFLLADSL